MDQSDDPNRSRLTIAPHDHLQGEMDALIILIEYGDYQCSYCAEVHKMIQTIQQRLNHQLCFMFRHFPQKQLHFQAQKAAEAAEAAAAQGKFWQMHNILLERQKFLSDGNLLEYANELELDLHQFLYAIAEHQYADRVAQDIQSGKQCDVTRTPTLFINQERYNDAWEVERLITAILSQGEQ
ncbi:thioredoxin domain-containing protein [Microcoleus sp. ARI1-B5]|uniref:DsbA family protein n=1 Tax=unclassified Microcoleus TaxID=2642155 RepID=UPI002FD661ED